MFIRAVLLAGAVALAVAWEGNGTGAIMGLVECHDGDNFNFTPSRSGTRYLGSLITVRFGGVDTPELRGAGEADRELAERVRPFTEAMLRGARRMLVREIELGMRRYLAQVIADGRDVAWALIAAGLGRPYFGGPGDRGARGRPLL